MRRMRRGLDHRLERGYQALLWAAVTRLAPHTVHLDEQDPLFGIGVVPDL